MEEIKYIVNIIFAYLLYPFTKYQFKNRRIWLVGGNAGELYVDNARAMYEYIHSKKGIEDYWVLNKNSTIKDKIKGEILEKGSVKSYLYFMNAEVVIFSHSIFADIVPFLYVIPIVNRFHYKVLKVFLNHGTVGFKARKALNEKTEKIAEKMVRSYDINICDSQFEKEIKVKKWWNVPKDTVFVTGYPRYDKLYDVKVHDEEIFYMPTWRPWLKGNDNIKDTKYFENIVNLLKNKRLNEFLNEKNIKFNIYIHQLMHEYFEKFDSIEIGKQIELLSKDVDITKQLMKSNILITDYSSVAYDYLYMKQPIIFYQFDKEEYEQKIGSYIDLEKDLFGEIAYTSNDVVEKIIDLVNNKYKYFEEKSKKVEILKEKFLCYSDKDNCKRVFELIEKKLEDKNGKNRKR